MAITINGSGITSANIADGTITASDISASEVKNLKSGRKNLIINGGFDVWQRGTTYTGSSSIYTTADRWWYNSSSETSTITRQSFDGSESGITTKHYIRTDVTTSSAYAAQTQRIENIYQFHNQTITLSFYARGGAGSGGVPTSFRIYMNGRNNGSVVDGSLIPSTNITLTSSWKKYVLTFDVGSITYGSYGEATSTDLHIFLQHEAYETCSYDIAQVQLELGSVATEFEHRSYGEELALCQRYYERWSSGGSDRRLLGGGWGGVLIGQYYVVKRSTAVTLTHSNAEIRDDSNTARTIDSVATSDRSFQLYSSGQAYKTGNLRFSGTGYIAFEAEL